MTNEDKLATIKTIVEAAPKREKPKQTLARARKAVGDISPAEVEKWLTEMQFLFPLAQMLGEVGELEETFIAEGRILARLLPKDADFTKHKAAAIFADKAAKEPAFAI